MEPEPTPECYRSFMDGIHNKIKETPCSHIMILSFPDDDSGIAFSCSFEHMENLNPVAKMDVLLNYINAFSQAMDMASDGMININDLIDRGVRYTQLKNGEEETGLDIENLGEGGEDDNPEYGK